MIEEYNPPCSGMGKRIAEVHTDHSKQKISNTAFSKASKLNRGLVGTIETTGKICKGDTVSITVYAHPKWLNN